MTHIYRFGATVRAADSNLGTLTRIILNNGIANQLVVDPGLLRSERVIPVSIVEATTPEEITLTIDPHEWGSYPALHYHREIDNPNADRPELNAITASPQIIAAGPDLSDPTGMTGARETEDTASPNAIMLSHSTEVVAGDSDSGRRLAGMIVDTGRPQQILLDDDTALAIDSVARWDERRIVTGELPPANPAP